MLEERWDDRLTKASSTECGVFVWGPKFLAHTFHTRRDRNCEKRRGRRFAVPKKKINSRSRRSSDPGAAGGNIKGSLGGQDWARPVSGG